MSNFAATFDTQLSPVAPFLFYLVIAVIIFIETGLLIGFSLLHDVGKTRSDLSTGRRVLATIVGPRTERFRDYHEHEIIGLSMCRKAGSSESTITLLEGRADAGIVESLRWADDI